MKKIVEPSYSEELNDKSINDIDGYRLDNCAYSDEELEEDYKQIEFYECKFSNVTIHHEISSCLFVDVIFDHCDFSNACFEETVFRRCIFQNCRMTGVDFSACSFSDVKLIRSQCTLMNLNQTKWNRSEWNHCIFQESSLHAVQLKDMNVIECDFVGCEIHRTPLNGIDLSTSNINNIAILPENLRGVIVNAEQAIALASLLGIIVK